MNYCTEINGMKVNAVYSEECIEQIFVPLLRKLTAMQKEKGSRLLVMLAAPPAAGKSTMVSFLRHLSESIPDVTPITAIGMDGFHHYQSWLLEHTLIRDGKEVCMVDVKGTPETFDLEKLAAAVARVAGGEVCGWPDYNRMLHNPVEDARVVDGDIVMLEGNYLLLDRPGWRDLHSYADYTIRINARENDLRDRLIRRKAASGASWEDAVRFAEKSDLYNARLCLANALKADLTLRMNSDGSYQVSPLSGKRILFLGSSVTYGAAAEGVSFADFLAQQNGCEAIKEAVSGTTLVDNGDDSYISRLKRLRIEEKVDLFICQLSTNDATRQMPIGTVSGSFALADFDTQTIAGAMEYIIAYAREVYRCPVAFYTNPKYDSAAYEQMVMLLKELQQKWNISVIDLWNDEAFNSISAAQRAKYLADPIHPTESGYLEWWTPRFETALAEILKNE